MTDDLSAPRGATGSLALDDFLLLRSSDRRLARLTHDIRLPEARGLEFGAAGNPTRLPEGVRVEYVDYDPFPDGAGERWVSVDHVWAGAGSLADICGPGELYDFAIACQVAQYVPNLLGWFRGIFDVLAVGGVLNLSLPDYRFTFDCARRTSTIAEAIEALVLDYARPSPRQLFDHTYGARAVEPGRRWTNDLPPETIPRLSGDGALDFAYNQCRDVLANPRYAPCHCWVFSPLSFLTLIEEASRLGLFPFVISQFSATEPGDFEFFACLRRDGEADPDRLRAIQLGAIAYVRDIARRQVHIAQRVAEG